MKETLGDPKKIIVEIYSKPGCHLCDEAKKEFEEVKRFFNLDIREVNIEGDEKLFGKYRYDIPVIYINGRKAFKHKIGAAQLKDRLEKEKLLLSKNYS